MRMLVALGLVVAGCADHGQSPDATDGELLAVHRGGGFCPFSFGCNGTVTFTDSGFVASLGDATIAQGSVLPETLTAIDLAIAKIPSDTPSTIPEPAPGGCDAGPTTFDVVVRGEAHSYTHQCTLGQLAALSAAVAPVMSAIAICTPSTEVTLSACTRTN